MRYRKLPGARPDLCFCESCKNGSELAARRLMEELFRLEPKHHGIAVDSQICPAVTYYFLMGDKMQMGYFGTRRTPCVVWDRSCDLPETDLTIAIALMVLANEKQFLRRTHAYTCIMTDAVVQEFTRALNRA